MDRIGRFVVLNLQTAGRDNEPHSIAELRYFTNGRVIVRGNWAERKNCIYMVAVRKYLPDVRKVLPVSGHGHGDEIIGKFGGTGQLCSAVDQLQSLLYPT